MRKILFYIAFLSSFLVIIIHVLALLGINIVENNFYNFLLSLGAIIIAFPTILYLKKDDRKKENENTFGLKILTTGKSKGLYFLIIVLIIYGVFGFLLFFAKTIGKGTVDIKNGVYISHNHGKDIKTITKEEYQLFKLNELRFSSSGWMGIYTIMAIGLYKPKKKAITKRVKF